MFFPANQVFGFWWFSDDSENKTLKNTIAELELKIIELENYNQNLDDEEYCGLLFADMYDLTYDMMFYLVIFNLSPNSNFNEKHVPRDLQDSIFADLESIQVDFTEYECEDYRYLLQEDEYLKWRYDTLEYHFSLLSYHSETYHQQSKVGHYLDEIEEHKELIKFFLPLLFG